MQVHIIHAWIVDLNSSANTLQEGPPQNVKHRRVTRYNKIHNNGCPSAAEYTTRRTHPNVEERRLLHGGLKAGHLGVHVALALLEPLVHGVRRPARLHRDLDLLQGDVDHVEHRVPEEPDHRRPRAPWCSLDHPLYRLAHLSRVHHVAGYRGDVAEVTGGVADEQLPQLLPVDPDDGPRVHVEFPLVADLGPRLDRRLW